SLAFKEAELRPLVALVPHLPLPEGVRRDIARFDPRGTVTNVAVEWHGRIDDPARYSLKSEFRRLSLAAHDAAPGVSNLAGTLDASERGGSVRIVTEAAEVALPQVFSEPMPFDTLRGDVSWRRNASDIAVELKDVAFANADVAGMGNGTWASQSSGPGTIDVKAQLTRANLANTYRYLPHVVGRPVTEWVRRALTKGTSNDVRLT